MCNAKRRPLPSLDVETLFGKLGRDDCSPRELTSSESLDSLLRRLSVLILDVDFANTEVGAGSCGTRDLSLDDGSVFAALLFDVFFDFYLTLVCCQDLEHLGMLTFVFLVVEQFIRSHHVHKANNAAVFVILSGAGSGKHGNGTDTTVETSGLLETDSCARNLEVTVTERDVVQAFNNSVDDFVISVLAECDTLQLVSKLERTI